MDWDVLIGKRIFVKLSHGAIYTGKVLAIDGKFFKLIDKFGELVYFREDDIVKIKEEASQ